MLLLFVLINKLILYQTTTNETTQTNNDTDINQSTSSTNQSKQVVGYYFEMNVNHIQEKDLGWELTQAIVSNTIAMAFVVIGAIIAYSCKRYILALINKKEETDDNKNDQVEEQSFDIVYEGDIDRANVNDDKDMIMIDKKNRD